MVAADTNVLVRLVTRDDADQVNRAESFEVPVVSMQQKETVAAALTLYRHYPYLGFSDCLILETARKAGHLPLGTFDRALGRVEGAQRL